VNIASAALCAALLAAPPPPARAAAFGPGEQTVMRVEYLGITAASATITVGSPTRQGLRSVWPIVTVADTRTLFGVYPLHDKFVTWWDLEAHHSLGWDFYANENRKSRRERVKLNAPEPGKAQIQRAAEETAPVVETVDIDPAAQDIAAAFFTLRDRELEPGAQLTIPVFTGRHAWDMVARVGSPEAIEVAAGKFTALPLEVEVHFVGKLESKRSIKVWLSSDARHALLRLEADLAFGSLRAETTEFHPGLDLHAQTP
jgi:hypothetical protein